LRGRVVVGEVESQNAFARQKHQPQIQLRPAFKQIRRELADAQSSVPVSMAEARLNLRQHLRHFHFAALHRRAEALRRLNRAGHRLRR